MTATDNFEKMLAAGRDSALLRFSLGVEYLKMEDPVRAAEHLAHAVELDPGYSAAWKLRGKALVAAGQPVEAQTVMNAASKSPNKAATNRPRRKCAFFCAV
jgi:Tfp pilus assembly protein PilF